MRKKIIMHIHVWHRVILICLLAATFASAFSQEVKINEKGERIIVFPDGSWKYYDPAKNERTFGGDAPFKEIQNIENLPEEEQSALLEEKAIWIAEESRRQAAQFLEIREDIRNDRLYLEDELESMKKRSDDFASFEIGLFEKRVESLRKEEKVALAQHNKAIERAELAEKIILAKPRKRLKLMQKLEEVMQEELSVPRPQKDVPRPVSLDEYLASYALYDPQKDVTLHPPDHPCELAFDGIDRFSGAQRRDLEKRLLFTHTREALRPYLDGREYITCMAQLTATGGLIYLTLEFTIVSNQAHLTFGGIPKGSVLTLSFMNGDKIALLNKMGDRGKYNAVDDTYTFKAQYLISGAYHKQLEENELDKLRIVWNTGYEDYNIRELDFFIDQMKCLY